jgi:hypothetical chaperone protein
MSAAAHRTFRCSAPDREGVSILANHGVRIGGTDFDRSLSIDRVMPHLGKGTELRKILGPGSTPTPNAIFNDLATWEMIAFLYTPQNRRLAAEMARLAHQPEKLSRLAKVLEDELGHDLAFAVERGKIAANGGAERAAILLDRDRAWLVRSPVSRSPGRKPCPSC